MKLRVDLVETTDDEVIYEGTYRKMDLRIAVRRYDLDELLGRQDGRAPKWEAVVSYTRRRWLILTEIGFWTTDAYPTAEAALEAGRRLAKDIGEGQRQPA